MKIKIKINVIILLEMIKTFAVPVHCFILSLYSGILRIEPENYEISFSFYMYRQGWLLTISNEISNNDKHICVVHVGKPHE